MKDKTSKAIKRLSAKILRIEAKLLPAILKNSKDCETALRNIEILERKYREEWDLIFTELVSLIPDP
jgi:hypothetical protein